MKTFSIFTLGCKVNVYESEFYRQSLLNAGYQEALPKEATDIVIINTCTVTNTASFKSRQRIHQAKRTNPNAMVVVVGCYAQTAHALLKEKYDIDLIIGAQHKDRLVELIENASQTHDFPYPETFEALTIDSFEHQQRAYLKIQDGCNQFCSYCIIPYARGRERSLPFDDVLNQVDKLKNHKEVVLTGIHTGRYGFEFNRNLSELLTAILKRTSCERIRISSIEITEIDDVLLHLMKTNPRLASHLHIPIQSGHTEILKAMNRPYTLEQFKECVKHIRSIVPDIHLSTDVIVGFPGETDEYFEESIKALQELKFGFIHVFPFSARENTKAESMKNMIDGKTKKIRVHKIQEISDHLKEDHLASLVGTQLSVLIEEKGEEGLFGYSLNYEPVIVDGDSSLVNTVVRCTVYSSNREYAYARLIP